MARSSDWFDPALRDSVKAAVQEVERLTSAEVIVAVRPSSGHYRHVDLGVGAFLSLVALCLFLYHPEPFDFTYLPLELALVFGVGVVVSSVAQPLRRLLTSRKLMDENVERTARSAFVELGVHQTRGRTGLLVLVSRFERRAAVVTDRGIVAAELGNPFSDWRARVLAAARRRDSGEFVEALRALGPLLAERLPRQSDDVNELADDLSESAA